MPLRTTHYALRTTEPRRAGFSFVELLIVIGITAIMSTVLIVGLLGRRTSAELSTTSERIAALLREAQSKSVGQASSLAWGVRFDNSSSPSYALFSGAYATSTREQYYALPASVRFATATIATNRYIDVTFAQLSGAATGSTSVKIYLAANPRSSSTITVDLSGAISY